MNIAHISIYPPMGEKHSAAGGVASYTKNLVANIPYAPTDNVFVLCDVLTGLKEYAEDRLTVKRCFKQGSSFFFQLFREIKRIKPDVIHIQQELNLYGGPFTAYLLQWLVFLLAKRNKVIITLHGVVDLSKVDREFVRQNNSSLPAWIVKIALRTIYAPLCKYANEVIVHEEKFKRILISDYKAVAKKISVIPHGVEELNPIDKDIARKALGIGLKKNVVLFMGYLTGYKGIDILIEGFAEYAKSDSESFLVIGAGKHPKLKNDPSYLAEYQRLENKARSMIPAGQYVWVGFIDEKDIPLYYSASDASVFPYTVQISSSGPMALAISYGQPILASIEFTDILPRELLFKKTSSSIATRLSTFFRNRAALSAISLKLKSDKIWRISGIRTGNLYQNL